MTEKPKTKPVVVLQDTDEAPEVLASAIREVSRAAKKLLNGPLSRRALLVLIQDNISGNIGLQDIGVVLDAASGLEKRYIVKPKESL